MPHCEGVSNRVYRLRVCLSRPYIYIQACVNTFSKYLEIHWPEFDKIFRVLGGSTYDFESLKISGSGEGVLREGVGKKKV